MSRYRTASIAELFVYPLKSARAVALPNALLAATGLEWDRHWMAVDPGGTFLSQRTHPQLARIEPELGEQELILRVPGLEPLHLPFEPAGEPVTVRIWKDSCTALDQGDRAAEWLREALAAPARLVRAAPGADRRASPRYAGNVPAPLAFPDGYPVLVVNRASLDELNARMPEPVPLERFRPNVVLGGLEPFAEDGIAVLRSGPVTLRLVKPCTRCVITATDQQTGERSTDPLPVLRQFRFDRNLLGVTFGENAVVVAGAGSRLARGSEFAVLKPDDL